MAAEGEQLLGQRGGPLPGLPDFLRVFSERIAWRHAQLDVFTVADDDSQEIVEIMRDPAGQASHRFHLLRLAELLFALPQYLFGMLALGNVPADSD